MDKNTLGNYGWVVITVIIISIMIALASPFAVALKGNFVGTVNDFGGRMDAALEGINNEDSEGETEEGPTLNEYGFYFNQPYRGDAGNGNVMELVFYEDGMVLWADPNGYCLPPESAVYASGSIELFGDLATISDDGTELSDMEEGMFLSLKETSYGTLQKEMVYTRTNGFTATVVFENDGSITWMRYDEENVCSDVEVYSDVEYFDHHFIIHTEEYDIYGAIYPDGTGVGMSVGGYYVLQ